MKLATTHFYCGVCACLFPNTEKARHSHPTHFLDLAARGSEVFLQSPQLVMAADGIVEKGTFVSRIGDPPLPRRE